MSRKAVFFDADGTVCDMKKGVPDSAIEAIRSLVDNGHEAWLCTGRSRAFVSWYLEQIPFTGMISACGSTIEKDGKRLFNKEMTPEVAKLSVEVLRKYGLIPVMEGADFMYYDKEEYTDEVNWYASLITESLGDKWRPEPGFENLVFTGSFGRCISENALYQDMKKIIVQIREDGHTFGEHTPHSLRHTFATRGFERGIPPKVMQEILGHKSITMTLDIYSHVLPDKKAEEINKLAAMF